MTPAQLWRGWTAPTVEGELARRREAVLLHVLASMIVLSLVTQLMQWISLLAQFSLRLLAWWLLNAATGACFYGLLRAARAGRHRFASRALVVMLAGLGLLLLAAAGVDRPMWPLVACLGVLLAVLLLGSRAGLVAVAAIAFVAVPIVALQGHGVLRPFSLDSGSTSTPEVVPVAVLLAVIVAVSALYTRDALVSIDEVLTQRSATSPLRRLRTKDLTLREVEVVQLVAAGLSNEAIARRLFVSPRTVQTHVANAMAKTSCANRTELGVLAVREGVVPLDTQSAGTPSPGASTRPLPGAPSEA